MSTFHSHKLISVKIDSTIAQFPIYHWTQVQDLKTKISQLSNIPVSDQRLYLGHIELSNSRLLDDYSLFSHKVSCGLVLEYSKLSESFIRRVPGAPCNAGFLQTIQNANQGLKMKLTPQLTWDGTGGVYLMRDAYKNVQGVFKPLDEEPCAPFNPRGHAGKIRSSGIRPGIWSGEGGYRETAAYFLDHQGFAGVPKTAMVESQHTTYNYGNQKCYPKKGSFQEYINNKGAIEDYSVTLFSKFEIQKIAILDIRILNLDRNEGNILVTNNNKLIPIDHSLSMPETIEITELDLCWMNFVQCRENIEESCLDYIDKIDIITDLKLIQDLVPISDKSLMNLRVAGELLKKGAKAGLTLQQIGSLLYRKDDESGHSVVEKIIKKSLTLHKSIEKSLYKIFKIEKRLSSVPDKVLNYRERSYSEDSEVFTTEKNIENQENSEIREVFITIKETPEENDCDESEFFQCNSRTLSLPCLETSDSRVSIGADEFAFNQKFFYYLESFLQLAVDKKVKEIEGFMNVNGRPRSISNPFDVFSEY